MILEPVFCKKQQQKVPDQLLVCGIGDFILHTSNWPGTFFAVSYSKVALERSSEIPPNRLISDNTFDTLLGFYFSNFLTKSHPFCGCQRLHSRNLMRTNKVIEPIVQKKTYISGRCVEMMKSGFEFLYTSLEEVCNHCHFCSLVCNRQAIMPLAPVFNTEMEINKE